MLTVIDGTCLICYAILFMYQMLIIAKFLVPLKIKDRYTILFYFFLNCLLISSGMELIARLAEGDSSYTVARNQHMTFGEICRNTANTSYIILGFIISATMFQLSVSLGLVLNMFDLKEANQRKTTYNVTLVVITLGYVACTCFENYLDSIEHREHLIFEVLGLIVLCLIFFCTIVELIRKLRIFVLEETKLEARLLSMQFCIFLLAYGSKLITLVYWIRNSPQSRTDVPGFLINTDVMSLVWVVVPFTFVLWM